MLNTSFAPWPSFSEEEALAVADVLRSNRVNYWTGDECRKFEAAFAAFAGSRYAVALANGTVALDVALKALGIGAGDEVVVTPRSFLASVSTVITAGADPVFADVDRNTQNISAATIQRVLTPRTRAIICVHLGGMPCDMAPIMALASQHNLKVIEDCAQAHGALDHGRRVGSIGHIGAWSFCQDKIMTTGGEGGMVTTDDETLWRLMWSYKDHGKSYDAVYNREHGPGHRWVHESFGTNWRMIETQAILGRLQLGRLPEWIAARTAHAERLADVCRRHRLVRVPQVPAGSVHAYYRFHVFIRPEHLADGWTQDRIVAEINEQGVPCLHGGCSEVYLEPAFDGTPWRPATRLPIARELGETSLAFLVHPTISGAQMDRACTVIDKVLSAATRPQP